MMWWPADTYTDPYPEEDAEKELQSLIERALPEGDRALPEGDRCDVGEGEVEGDDDLAALY
jgi:hypothetical protein